MVSLVQRVIAISILVVVVGCSSVTTTYTTYSEWDENKDQKISRSEFVDAYLAQGYFNKWGAGARSIGYDDLFTEAFESIDSNKDGQISLVEFNSQIKLLYFGLFSESFNRWDDDSSASITKKEFLKHVATTNLATLWDTDDDKRITESEMAGGMFYIGDADSNGSVDETELNTWKRNRRVGVELKNMP